MAQRSRYPKRVQWNPGESPRAVRHPHPFIPEVELPPPQHEAYAPFLVEGTLWLTTHPLTRNDAYDEAYQLHEYKYLMNVNHSWGASPASFPVGTLAVYMGVVRVSENNHRGDMMRTPRHSFLVGGCRYITNSLADFRPAAL